jgi:TetR/AcrR family transcriptional regulator, repressor of the ameABC operon
LQRQEDSVRRPRRRAEDTRAEILDTAETLFRTRGVSGCSIAHIAQALSMSPANVFKHFHSKVALADAICDRLICGMSEQVEAFHLEGPAPDRLKALAFGLMDLHIEAMAENHFMVEMIFHLSEAEIESGKRYEEMIETLFSDLIRHGVETGIYYSKDPGRSGRVAAAAFASVLHPVFLTRRSRAEIAGQCGELVDLVNAALQNPLAK